MSCKGGKESRSLLATSPGVGGATAPVATPTIWSRNSCPYCHTVLRLVGQEFVRKKEESFRCITCGTLLVYESELSGDDRYFIESSEDFGDDDDDPWRKGDFDCDEGEIAVFEDLLNEPRPLVKGDPVTVETKSAKGGKVVRFGWLLADPHVLQNPTSRAKGVYRYAVVFDVAPNKNLEPHYFPPLAAVPKGKVVRIKAQEIASMAQVQRHKGCNLQAAQREAGHFTFKPYHGASATQRLTACITLMYHSPTCITLMYHSHVSLTHMYPHVSLTHRYNALTLTSGSYIVCKGFRTFILAEDLRRLATSGRVNDELMNFYIKLLVQRFSCTVFPIFAFNSYFLIKFRQVPDLKGFKNTKSKKFNDLYRSCNFQGVRCWTNKVDIFRYKVILIPVFKDSDDPDHRHRQMVVAHIDRKPKKKRKRKRTSSEQEYIYLITLSFCCSLGLPGGRIMKEIKTYFVLEHRRQHQSWLPDNAFKFVTPEVPQQTNAVDCGVHVCGHAYTACLGFPMDEKIPIHNQVGACNEFRKHMALSIADTEIREEFKYSADTISLASEI